MKTSKITLAILAVSSLLMSSMAISVMLQDIAQTFPAASTIQIQSIFTITTGVAMIAAFIAGPLASLFTKKLISIFASLCLLIGGMIPYFIHSSILVLTLGSILIGIGTGLLTTISTALIAEYFSGEKRIKLMGFQVLAISGGGILISLIAGYLTTTNWVKGYLIFLLFIPLILVLLIFLPKGIIEKAAEGEKTKVLTFTVIRLSISALLAGIFFATLTANIAFHIVNLVGSVSSVGIVISFMSIGTIFAGLILGLISKLFKNNIMAVGLCLLGIGLFILFLSNSILLCFCGAFCCGLGFGIFMASGFARVPSVVSPAAATMAIAIFASAMNLGQFLNPFVITSVAGLINNNLTTRFLISAIGCLLIFIINVFFEYKENKKISSAE